MSLRCRLLARQFLVQILFAERRDGKGKTNCDGDEHRRGNIRILEPAYFLKAFEDIST
jgi:hypothetical protein